MFVFGSPSRPPTRAECFVARTPKYIPATVQKQFQNCSPSCSRLTILANEKTRKSNAQIPDMNRESFILQTISKGFVLNNIVYTKNIQRNELTQYTNYRRQNLRGEQSNIVKCNQLTDRKNQQIKVWKNLRTIAEKNSLEKQTQISTEDTEKVNQLAPYIISERQKIEKRIHSAHSPTYHKAPIQRQTNIQEASRLKIRQMRQNQFKPKGFQTNLQDHFTHAISSVQIFDPLSEYETKKRNLERRKWSAQTIE
ncbi:Hypothetical_protein [Hexamita inflata]|uniref:Hypothetical_protein n=1 Tax=Hexamita inflata TaxID=28002 RepID=A0AA86Q7V8_9EUKA|nr:Hypothetical protein HINF_LOCUS41421 [Hexamita inflata]